MDKLKYLLILIVPLIAVLYTFVLVGSIYNCFRNCKVKIGYDDVSSYIKASDELEEKIISTDTYKDIFNQVFEANIECSLFYNNCLTSNEILNKIDEKVDSLYEELNLVVASKKEVRSSTFLLIKSIYDDNTFELSNKVSFLDKLFEKNFIKEVLYFCLILVFFSLIISSIKWTKYNGVSMIISSAMCMILLILSKFLSLFMYSSNTKIIIASYIEKVSWLCLNKCYYFLVIGCFFIVISYIFNILVKNKEKKA